MMKIKIQWKIVVYYFDLKYNFIFGLNGLIYNLEINIIY